MPGAMRSCLGYNDGGGLDNLLGNSSYGRTLQVQVALFTPKGQSLGFRLHLPWGGPGGFWSGGGGFVEKGTIEVALPPGFELQLGATQPSPPVVYVIERGGNGPPKSFTQAPSNRC